MHGFGIIFEQTKRNFCKERNFKIMAIQKLLKRGLLKVLGNGTADEGEGAFDLSSVDLWHFIKGAGVAALCTALGGAGAVFSSYPLGIAYLSAANRYVYFAYFGLLASSVMNKGYALPMAVTYTVILMLRYALCRMLADGEKNGALLKRICAADTSDKTENAVFSEPPLIRIAVACFAALVFGLYRLVAGGFLYYDLFGLLAGFFVSPLATLALCGLFTKDERFTGTESVSRAALMFITVFAFREYTPFGFSLGFIAAFFVAMWAATSLGGLKSCAVGLLMGLACGGLYATGDGQYLAYTVGAAPCIIATAALCMGMIWKLSRISAIISACAVSLFLGFGVDGYAVLPRLLPDIATAAALFMPLSHFGVLKPIGIFTPAVRTVVSEDISLLEKKQSDTNARMLAISDAFSHLSDTVYALSDRMRRPGVADLKKVCDDAFEGFCRKCAMESVCLEKECAATLDAQSKITGELYRTGRVSVENVPEFLRNRCFNILPIVDEINLATGKLIEQLIRTDKTEAFALDYDAMSRLLAEQIARNDAEYKPDTELTKKLRRSLKYMGIPQNSAICCGARKKLAVIGGIDAARMRMGAKEIRQAVENTIEAPMGMPVFSIEDGNITMTLEARRAYKTEVAKASNKKESEHANGDSTAIFENKEDYFYALISDGMGSGKEAAITSKICSVFIERMLSAGNGRAITLEMLNGFIRSREGKGAECSATVDLAEIDLITGKACFIKSGAAPSFVLRSGNLYKLQSKTVPIGIMSEIDAEKIGFDLASGDVIIMLSDGIAESLEDGVWLANLLTYGWEDDLNRMAEKILENAGTSNKRNDDMTVVLIRVSESNGE